MKNYKKLLALFIAILCICSSLLCFNSFAIKYNKDNVKPIGQQRPYIADDKIKIVDHVVYYKENDHYSVIDFFDTDEQEALATTITITDRIDDLPVTQIKTATLSEYIDFYDQDEIVGNSEYKFSTDKMNTRVKEINLPETIEVIGVCSFAKFYGVKELNIPDSVKTIDDGAFYGMINLTKVKLPSGLTKLNDAVFMDCRALYEINLDNITKIGRRTFYGSSFNRFNYALPKSLKSIGYEAFKDTCLNGTLEIPDNCEIGRSAFGNTKIQELSIGSGCKIGSSAFLRCGSLEIVNFKGSKKTDTSIDSGAFRQCYRLREVYFPENICSLTIGGYVFDSCFSLETIVFPNTYSKSSGFVVCAGAFYNCKSLKTIENIEKAKLICGKAFYDCVSLNTLTISNDTTKISSTAFKGCENLKKFRVLTTKTSVIKNNATAFKNLSGNCKVYVKTSKIQKAIASTGFKGKIIVKADLA